MIQRLALTLASITVLCTVGCFSPWSEHDAGALTGLSSTSETAETESPLDRLLKTPADPSCSMSKSQSVAFYPLSSVQDLAADGPRYILYVDSVNQIAWIGVSGGIGNHLSETLGPWPLENRDVQQLLNTLDPDF